ncbi:hypothetical protein IWX49DRAFT_585781 [Phyllosticta citricarpa]|uniref:Secreted protein n=1 Tax=Phyllosticta citricarpa TaxID=55181 RepID=A0ABR1L4D9_9PEZI
MSFHSILFHTTWLITLSHLQAPKSTVKAAELQLFGLSEATSLRHPLEQLANSPTFSRCSKFKRERLLATDLMHKDKLSTCNLVVYGTWRIVHAINCSLIAMKCLVMLMVRLGSAVRTKAGEPTSKAARQLG